jgi:hypothetical protein
MFALLEELNNAPEGPDRTALWERINADLAAREQAGAGIAVDPIEAIRFGSNPAPNPMDNLMDFFAASESFFSNISRDPADIMASGGWQPGMTWRDQVLEKWEPMLASIENPELQEYMRGIASNFATGLSLPAMIAEPGPGELGLAARELLPLMGLIPKLPVGLQKLMAQFIPAELLDAQGYPLRLFHGGLLPQGAGTDIPLAITNSEGHGHWGFFLTPMIENAAEYPLYRMTDSSAMGSIDEFLFAPSRTMRSTRFPGNDPVNTIRFKVTQEQADEFVDVMEQLRPIIRQADARLAGPSGVHTAVYEAKLDDLIQEVRNAPNGRWEGDIGEFYRRANANFYEIGRRYPDLMDGNRFISELSDVMDFRMDHFGSGQTPVPRTPDMSFTDMATRAGYDAGMGPWAPTNRVNFSTNPNVAAIPSEVASYVPGVNVIPAEIDAIVDFLRVKGIPEEAIQAAIRTELPQGQLMLGNRIYDKQEFVDDILDLFKGGNSGFGDWWEHPALREPQRIIDALLEGESSPAFDMIRPGFGLWNNIDLRMLPNRSRLPMAPLDDYLDEGWNFANDLQLALMDRLDELERLRNMPALPAPRGP